MCCPASIPIAWRMIIIASSMTNDVRRQTWQPDGRRTVRYRTRSTTPSRTPSSGPAANCRRARASAIARNVARPSPRLAARRCPACGYAWRASRHWTENNRPPAAITAAAARTVNCVEPHRRIRMMHQPQPTGTLTLTGREPLFMIMNAGSGKHDSTDRQAIIKAICEEGGRQNELLLVKQGNQLEATAKQAVKLAREQAGVVVAVGGDGTLHAVCQAVVGQGVPFGVLPQGTFNYFGRAHGISQDLEQALRDLLDARL